MAAVLGYVTEDLVYPLASANTTISRCWPQCAGNVCGQQPPAGIPQGRAKPHGSSGRRQTPGN